MARRKGVEIIAIKEALRGMTKISSEIRYKSCFEASKFTTGVIAFHPQTRSSPNQIHHADKDVICFVLKGRGRLRLQDRKILLRPGMLCHIPKRTPHDFAAGQRAELVLLYSLVRTGEA